MSSFFGGPQLVEVKNITNTSSGTIYTVPSGRYAEVTFITMIPDATNRNFTIAGTSFEVSNVPGENAVRSEFYTTYTNGEISNNLATKRMNDFKVFAGETIDISNNFTEVNIIVFEYSLP